MSRPLLVCCAVLVATSYLPAQSKFGFVDVQEVILKYSKTAKITDDIEKDMRAAYETLRQKQEAIKARYDSLSLLEDGLDRLRQLRQIKIDEVGLEIEDQNIKYQLETKLASHMKHVYEQVLRYSQSIAKDKGYEVIFLVTSEKLEDAATRADVSSGIVTRQVVWHDSSLDITQEVLKALNSQ